MATRRTQRQNSSENIFTGFVNLFRAEYAPEVVTVDEDRLLEVLTKPGEVVQAVSWIEEQYKGKAMIWTLLPNLMDSEALMDAQGDCTDISIYLDRPPVLEDILSFCASSRSWIEGETGNICILLYYLDIKTVRWSTLLSSSYRLYVGRSKSAEGAVDDVHRHRTLYKRSKKRTPPLTHQLSVYLRYIEALTHTAVPKRLSAITIREVVMRGIPRCAVAAGQPAGCIPMLAVRSGASGEVLYQSRVDRHYSPESVQEGVVRWSVPNTVCFGDVIIGIHHCAQVGRSESLWESRQRGELLFEVGVHSAMIDSHNSAPQQSSTTYMHPFACCLQTPPDTECICLDRQTLGIPNKDNRFRLDFHVEVVLAKTTAPDDSAAWAGAIASLKQFTEHVPGQHVNKRGSAVGISGVLKVTPNPKDILREFRGTASQSMSSFGSEADVADNVNSTAVRFSFPPVKDPFTETVNASLLAEEGSAEGLMRLRDGQWGLPVHGFCMVLSLLVVLEPLESDVNAKSTGNWKKCRIRIPIEKITAIKLVSGRLDVEWDLGDARGKQSVAIDDQGLPNHVDDLAAKLKSNMMRNVQAVRAMAVGETPLGQDDDDDDTPLKMDSESQIADVALAKSIRRLLPYRFRDCSQWDLLFSTHKHGSSVGTFFNRTGWRSPTLLLVMDQDSYFGTGETFVFRVEDGWRVQPYRWQQGNDMFQLAHKKDGIAVGGGKCHAIWFDAAFENGSSGPCETFNSPPLSSTPTNAPFRILHMEAWGMEL